MENTVVELPFTCNHGDRGTTVDNKRSYKVFSKNTFMGEWVEMRLCVCGMLWVPGLYDFVTASIQCECACMF